MAIVCKSAAEIERMRQSGRIVREVLDYLRTLVKPGVTTMDLERAAEKKIKELGAKPAFKGYYDYPCVLCTSVNEEIVHGIPSEKRMLKLGDIVSIDCGAVLDGYYGDAAITVPVDEVKPELQKLLQVTEASLYRGIEQARIGNSVGEHADLEAGRKLDALERQALGERRMREDERGARESRPQSAARKISFHRSSCQNPIMTKSQ